jgi:hypothetical protein
MNDMCSSGLRYSEWIDAVFAGIDPAPHFQEIAAISSRDRPQIPRMMSIQAAMLHVAADLGRFSPPDVRRIPELVAALRSRECLQQYRLENKPFRYPVEMAAALALYLLGPEARAAAPALCQLMEFGLQVTSFNGELGRLVQRTLLRIGAEAVPALQPLLASSHAAVRLFALPMLARLDAGGSALVSAIEKMVDDPDQLVCCQALTTLGEIGSQARVAIPTIRRALKDEDYLIRMVSVRSRDVPAP